MGSPLGKNQLGKFLLDTVSAAGLQFGKIKLSNHSVRKTSIGRLLDASFPKRYVLEWPQKLSKFIRVYKSASLSHKCQMSDALSRRNQPATSSCIHINLDDSVNVPSASNIQNAATSVSSSYLSTSNAREAIFAGANISSVSDCTFQIMTGPVNIINEAAFKRPRRHIIESNDED